MDRTYLAMAAWLLVGCGDQVTVIDGGEGASSSTDSTSSTGSTVTGTTTTTTTSTGSSHPELVGEWLLAATPAMSPLKPAPFHATVDVEGDELTMTLTPLHASDYAIVQGPPQTFGPYLIDADGLFVADIGLLHINGNTNPITDSDLVLEDLSLTALATTPFPCGRMAGTITSPLILSLEGSDWAMTRIDDGPLPPIYVNCDGDIAQP